MPTVKRKASGAIILKNGKVSCGCCAQAGCCMYPAQALVDGLYSVDDLPDEILVSQILLELDQTLFTKTGDNQNFYTGIGIGAVTISVVIHTYEGMNGETRYVWALDFSGELLTINTNPFCLIFPPEVEGGTGTEDTFADSYTVTACSYPAVIGATVSRVSQCTWQGTFLDPENPYANGPQSVWIVYCPGEFQGCGGGLFENENGVEVPFFYSAFDIGGSGGAFAKKTPHANSPAGNYEGEMSITFE